MKCPDLGGCARGLKIKGATFLAYLLTLAVSTHAQSPSFGFPVAGQNPYTAPIISVIDHSADYFYDQNWTEVLAYTGEKAAGAHGSTQPYGFQNSAAAPFIVNGMYKGSSPDGPTYLNYRAHSGYDYEYGSAVTPVAIVAAQDGTIYIPARDAVNNALGSDPWCTYHTFYIDHGNGWTTWYLHASNLTAGTPHLCPNGISSNITADEKIAIVRKGDPVALVGNFANGAPGGVGYHLHFEVRRGCDRSTGSAQGCLVVDPYGWEWPTGDTISQNVCKADSAHHCATSQNAPLWNLTDWGLQQPSVASVVLAPSSGGYTATISGQNFAPSALVTLWDLRGQYFLSPAVTPSSNTGTQIVAQLPISNPGNIVLKIKNPQGPRSTGWVLAVPSATTSVPLTLNGQPADGGGNFAGFSGFWSLTNRGNGVFGAGIDTNGDGAPDSFADFKLSGNQITKLTAPGFGNISSTASHVRLNNRGDMAFGDINGAYGGAPAGIYVLPSGNTLATPVVTVGQSCASPCPISGSPTYYGVYGPLAFNDAGDVVFTAALLNPQTNVASCCFLFLFSGTDGSIVKVAADGSTGDPTPVGGNFALGVFGPGTVAQITSAGDVLFLSQVSGGTSSGGIFRWSRATSVLSKVVVQGDAASVPGGGSFGFPLFGKTGSVSGQALVFHAPIVGGTTSQAIIVVKDVTQNSFANMVVAAYQGEATGTSVGGSFASPFGQPPFGGYGNNSAPPTIRADGSVVFHSLLSNAQINGTPTGQGVFRWDGRGFQKIAVDGDAAASGKTMQGVFATAANDTGEVLYFVASLQ